MKESGAEQRDPGKPVSQLWEDPKGHSFCRGTGGLETLRGRNEKHFGR